MTGLPPRVPGTEGETPYVEGGELADVVDLARNGDVAAYLAEHRPSCHSDTGEALIRGARGCGDWVAFSPSFRRCLYVALVTDKRVFALGLGQSSVLFRLPEPFHATALASGAVAAPEVGGPWVRFELFRPDLPAPDLAFWALRAYQAARERDV
jgi:hypothetical protein